jgi:hypothetical protein
MINTSKSLKILQVANFDYKNNFHQFYNCDYKLYFGLIKNGHSVYQFSNRDIARQDGFFKSRFGSKKVQNDKLIKVTREMRPDLILLGHAEQIDNATLNKIRSENKNIKIAAFNVDALWLEHNVQLVKERSKAVDALFLTTAGGSLKQFSRNGLKIAFVPNPVDESIDKYRCFENNNPEFDIFFAGGGEYRVGTCNYLKKKLPDLKFHTIAQTKPTLVYGQGYLDELKKCWIGINLPQFTDDHYQPYLYSSDRVSQYFGNGLLTVCHKKTGYSDLLEEGKEALFYSTEEELAEKLQHAKINRKDSLTIAENGWKKYHMLYNSKIITQYMVDVIFSESLSQNYKWPVDIY